MAISHQCHGFGPEGRRERHLAILIEQVDAIERFDKSIGVLPRFHGHLTKAPNGPGGCQDTATQVSAEYKREAVAILEVTGVTVHQVARELGIGVGVLGRWRRELCQETPRTFPGQGRPREEEVVQLKRELARVTKERDFLREAAAFFARASR